MLGSQKIKNKVLVNVHDMNLQVQGLVQRWSSPLHDPWHRDQIPRGLPALGSVLCPRPHMEETALLCYTPRSRGPFLTGSTKHGTFQLSFALVHLPFNRKFFCVRKFFFQIQFVGVDGLPRHSVHLPAGTYRVTSLILKNRGKSHAVAKKNEKCQSVRLSLPFLGSLPPSIL